MAVPRKKIDFDAIDKWTSISGTAVISDDGKFIAYGININKISN